MIKPDMTHVKTLEEFYKEICKQQSDAHGEEYIAHHKALIKCVQDPDVNMVKELGVCQGGTLAAMMLQNPYQLKGYDIFPAYYEPYAHLFEEYAKKRGIVYNYYAESSTNPSSACNCDLLHIDSLHDPDHLMQELQMHAKFVKKYIVFHDTANFKNSAGLFKVIAEYITDHDQSWKIIDHYIHRVGYTVIQREERLPEVYNNLK